MDEIVDRLRPPVLPLAERDEIGAYIEVSAHGGAGFAAASTPGCRATRPNAADAAAAVSRARSLPAGRPARRRTRRCSFKPRAASPLTSRESTAPSCKGLIQFGYNVNVSSG